MSCCRNSAQPILRRIGARAVAPTPARLLRAMSTAAPTATVPSSENTEVPQANARRPRFQGRNEQRPQVPPQSLPELLMVLSRLKSEGRTPTPTAYLALIRSAADYGARRGNNRQGKGNSLGLEIALGAMRDAEAGGIDLGPEALDQLFRFTFIQPEILPSLLIEAANSGQPTSAAYNAMAQQAAGTARPEEMLVILAEMLAQNMVPQRSMVKSLVRLLCEWGMPRLAMHIVERVDALPGSQKMDSSVWIDILRASADSQYTEGVDKAWRRCVSNKAFTPDEGLILNILAVAARWGRTELASSALAVLPEIGVQAQEHHMAPLVTAFCRARRVPDALKLIGQLRASGIEPKMTTVNALVKVLNTPELLDQAFFALEDMHKAGTDVDVVAFNAVVSAAAQARDLQRARATQLAAKDLGVTSNIDTFNFVLMACRNARHMQLGDTVFAELNAAGLTPNRRTYETMIYLLLTEQNYENAFWYLEKMKSEGIKPMAEVYTAIGVKCFRNNDSRYKLVGEEMATIGYPVPNFEAEANKTGERRRAQGGDNRRNNAGGDNRRNNNRRRDGNRRQGKEENKEA